MIWWRSNSVGENVAKTHLCGDDCEREECITHMQMCINLSRISTEPPPRSRSSIARLLQVVVIRPRLKKSILHLFVAGWHRSLRTHPFGTKTREPSMCLLNKPRSDAMIRPVRRFVGNNLLSARRLGLHKPSAMTTKFSGDFVCARACALFGMGIVVNIWLGATCKIVRFLTQLGSAC